MSTQLELSSELVQLFDLLPSKTRSLALIVRKLVLAALPGAIEIPDAKARVIGYGYGLGYKDLVATIILGKSSVKLGLVEGVSLPDPCCLLEGTGKKHRYIVCSGAIQIRQPAVKSLLRAGLAAWKARTVVGASPRLPVVPKARAISQDS